MASILNEQIKNIVSYELCMEEKQIKNISTNSSSRLNDTIKILAILDSLYINYSIDDDYNFHLFPECSYRKYI